MYLTLTRFGCCNEFLVTFCVRILLIQRFAKAAWFCRCGRQRYVIFSRAYRFLAVDADFQPCHSQDYNVSRARAGNIRREIPRTERFGISAAGSRFAHARKAPQVKPRRADCTARESVWESRSLPALNKGQSEKSDWPFPFLSSKCGAGALAREPASGTQLWLDPQPAIILRPGHQTRLHWILPNVFTFLPQTLVRTQHMVERLFFPNRP